MPDKEIIISPSALHAPKVITVENDLSIREIIKQANPEYPESLIVEINGNPVARNKWDLKPDVNDHVLIYAPIMGGGGGKNPLRTLLMIAVVVASAGLAAPLAGAIGVTSAIGTSLIGAGIMTAGMLLVDAIAPIKAPQLNSSTDPYSNSPTYSIAGGSNRANPWGAVPLNLGVNKVYPPLGSGSYTEILDTVETKQKYVTPTYYGNNPYPPYMEGQYITYKEVVGTDEYFRMLVVWGYGPLDISDIKIGDTLLSSYSDYEIETREGWSTDTPITIFPSQVNQETVGVELTQAGGMVQRTAPDTSCDELSVDLSFPSGLVQIEDDGSKSSYSVTVLIQYREVGAGSWTTHETKVFTDKTTSAIRYGTSWAVDNTKEYEIGITRQTADTGDSQIIDTVYWVNLRCITCDDPLGSVPYPVAATAIKIKATDQLNSYIDTLNGVVSSYVPVWDNVLEEWGTDEGDYEISQNPAALYRYVLMCPANAKARTASQIDDAALGEWYEFCETNGYKFNLYKDTQSSVWETLASIAAAGRASPALIEGLWSVTVDTGDQTLVQHITPRNSWGFSSEKILFDPPHAFRIRFVNEDNDYEWDERIVYDDGYNSGNATLFESITLIGITDPDLIWKFGRFHIAQARLRPEVYTLNMDFEHLVCNRGSLVRVSHDVPLWGVGSGRVKTLVLNGPETHITHVVLDEYITMESGNTYVCRFRLASGITLIESIVLDVGETNTIEFTTPVLIASGPEVGDLAMFGITDLETVELLVKSITRSGDLTAQLQLVDFAEDIYDADTGEIPAFNPSMTAPTDVTRIPPDPPTIENITASLDVSTTAFNGAVGAINVYLSPPEGNIQIRGYKIRFRLVDETVWTYTPETKSLTVPINLIANLANYQVQAQSISVYGIESEWSEIHVGNADIPQLLKVGTELNHILIDGANTRVRSSNYVSGAMGAGFTLEPELLEVGNIAARGIIRTSVFEYNSISVHSGSTLVAMGGDVLAADMTADEDGGLYLVKEDGDKLLKEDGDGILLNSYVPLTIEGNDTFAVGDILQAKEGTDDEYMRVLSISDAPIYYVLRDIKGDYAADSNPTWPKGTSIVNHGPSGKGGIYITASDTNAPYLSIYTHAGEPWNKTTLIREGNLNGYAGYSSDVYGWASYLDANNYIKIDAVNGIQMSGNIIITGGSGIANLSDVGALATADTLDDVPNGSTYGKVLSTSISAGKIILTSGTGVSGSLPVTNTDAKCTDALADQTSANQSATTASLAGHTLDNLGDGSTYKRVASTQITAGKITACGTTASFNINSAIFGNAGIQLQYNAGSPRMYIGDGSNEYLQYISGTGLSIGLEGADSNPSKISIAGSSYTTDIYGTSSGIFHYKTYGDDTHYADLYQYASSSIAQMTMTSRCGSYSAGLNIIAESGGDQVIRPISNGDIDLGDASYQFSTFHAVHGYFHANGSPAYQGDLTAEGIIKFPYVYSNNFASGNDVYVTSAGYLGYISSSVKYKDLREKITDVSWLKDIDVWYYNHKKEPGLFAGFTAEQLYDVQPKRLINLVSLNNDGYPETVNYSQMVPHLTAGWQNHDDRISQLEKENKELRELLKKQDPDHVAEA